jgi:DnaJ-class molecular chaperone
MVKECKRCEGTGSIMCVKCDGESGWIKVYGIEEVIYRECDKCGDTGKQKCPNCGGAGEVETGETENKNY